MTSLSEFEKNIGGHEIYLDPATPGVNHPGYFVPCTKYILNSYGSIGDQTGFKRDKPEVFDKYMGNSVKDVKNGHILNKSMVYVNETDKERINPANLLQFNRRAQVPSNQLYSSVYGEGVSKVGHNKNHTKGRYAPAGSVFGTRLNDPHASNPNQRAGANQSINDPLLLYGPGTFNRGGNLHLEKQQQIDKSVIGEVRFNPNRTIGKPECRTPGYLIDGLIANPESIYHDGKFRDQPSFFCDTTATYNQRNVSLVKPCSYKIPQEGLLHDINPQINTQSLLYY